ncbi:MULTISPECIES: alpha/beta fold hydrolase [Streptococcus]|uniref:alpha/beta fold hydrolase n=1 Tax=Streptococcus TaxID=1301 RepID=UPI0003D6103E|nr:MULTISPECIES: alpha/beta fold hydrolase [Streptococcus]ETJ03334.1 MAG: Hydrolase, alpha/beta protein [Streptococcus parasanguinis DORA_23_24]MCP9067655.1 alpha/beta hydrolase [Streptococcus parasanguinis]MDU3000720.1 alpha/beta fold hydrolase [Streptococcus parasanguinis]OHQ86834.1 alpha/beta hydrolase [Streptococcus sp. HMSC076C09]
MQFYFIGGLGGNGYHLAPLIDELGFPVTFLDPYREMIQTEKDLCAWFQDQIGQDEEICLLGHSLGGDLARYLAAEFPQIRALILLDGGYLDMEKILPLEEELEGTSSFMQQQVFATVEEAVSAELGDEVVPSPMTRKAVEASYRWNPVSEQYELNLDLEKVMALLRLRRQIKANQISVADKPVLFIGPRYQEEPEWRKEALKQLDPQIEQVLLDGLGHELYTEAPEIVAREVNNWLQNVHK